MKNITWDGLVVYVADEDFIEYLHELGYDTIEEVELYEEWDAWVLENVEPSPALDSYGLNSWSSNDL